MSNVIVTGAASGMGKAVCERFVERGDAVLAVDIDSDGLERLGGELGDAVLTARADLTREEDVRAYAEAARERFGEVDGFFNNAGIAGYRKSIVDLPVAEWEAAMRVNLLSAFMGLKYVIPLLRRPAGSVVTTSSIAAIKAEFDRSDYVVSKLAVIGLTKTAAAEHGAEGLRFNCICPGPTETPMIEEHERWVGDDVARVRSEIAAMNPMQRYAKPSEIASLVEFLLVGDSRYVTGTAIPIDGGYLAV